MYSNPSCYVLSSLRKWQHLIHPWKQALITEMHCTTVDIRGLPLQSHQLKLRGVCYSAFGVPAMEGVQDVYITDNPLNFCAPSCFLYIGINQNLVVIDNVSIHYTDAAVNTICGVGTLVKFWSYLPDLNPTECVFCKNNNSLCKKITKCTFFIKYHCARLSQHQPMPHSLLFLSQN